MKLHAMPGLFVEAVLERFAAVLVVTPLFSSNPPCSGGSPAAAARCRRVRRGQSSEACGLQLAHERRHHHALEGPRSQMRAISAKCFLEVDLRAPSFEGAGLPTHRNVVSACFQCRYSEPCGSRGVPGCRENGFKTCSRRLHDIFKTVSKQFSVG